MGLLGRNRNVPRKRRRQPQPGAPREMRAILSDVERLTEELRAHEEVPEQLRESGARLVDELERRGVVPSRSDAVGRVDAEARSRHEQVITEVRELRARVDGIDAAVRGRR